MNGRRKGLKFENDVCRILSTWYGYDGELPMEQLPFRRRFTSTTSLEGHWVPGGDILHRPGINFPFAVECKKIEGWELDGIFTSPKWPVWSWWSQCEEQAEKVGKLPLLFFTRNLRPIYILMSEGTASCLQVRPAKGPTVKIQRPGAEALALTNVDVLLDVPADLARKLAPRPRTLSEPSRSGRGLRTRMSTKSSARRSK